MAGRIAGITVEIGGDTTGLNKALKSVDSSIKTTQTSLKDVNRETEAPRDPDRKHVKAPGDTEESLRTGSQDKGQLRRLAEKVRPSAAGG